MSRWFFSALLLSAVGLGCGGEGEVGNEIPHLRVTRSTTFGDDGGEGALSGIFSVAVSGDGHVYLSEPQFARVVEFNPDGTFSRVVGGRGSGPGEFAVPGGLWWRGDSLAVSDFRRGIHLFSPRGEFADLIYFHINDGSSAFGLRPIFPLADGSMAAFAPAGNSEIASGAVIQQTWVKVSRDGAIMDTLAVVGLEGSLYSMRYGERPLSGAHPLSWAPILRAPPSGTSFVLVNRPVATGGDVATYQVFRLGLDGDTLNAVSLEYEPVPLQPQQIDSLALEMAQGRAETMNATVPSLASAIADQIQWPDYQPPVTEVVCGSDGTVWLRREAVGVELARWEILDENLKLIGRVDLPLGLEVEVVAREWVYGVELDEIDVPSVVRFDVGNRQ